jgi:hypothetical protein
MKTVTVKYEAVKESASDHTTYNWSTAPLAENFHYPVNKVQN